MEGETRWASSKDGFLPDPVGQQAIEAEPSEFAIRRDRDAALRRAVLAQPQQAGTLYGGNRSQLGVVDGLDVEGIARICHEANRAYCLMIGDDSQPRWEDAPEWAKDSARQGVAFHLEAMMENRWLDGRASHDNWMSVKLRDGWRYGAVKDAEAKTHPCLLPYNELPAEQRRKDDLFMVIVHAVARSVR